MPKRKNLKKKGIREMEKEKKRGYLGNTLFGIGQLFYLPLVGMKNSIGKTFSGILQTLNRTKPKEEENKKMPEKKNEEQNLERSQDIKNLEREVRKLKKDLKCFKQRSFVFSRNKSYISSIARLENTDLGDLDTSLSSDLPNPIFYLPSPQQKQKEKSNSSFVEKRFNYSQAGDLISIVDEETPVALSSDLSNFNFDCPPPPPPCPPVYISRSNILHIDKSNSKNPNLPNNRPVLDLNAILSVRLKPCDPNERSKPQRNDSNAPLITLDQISNLRLKKRSNPNQIDKKENKKPETPPFARIQLRKSKKNENNHPVKNKILKSSPSKNTAPFKKRALNEKNF